MMEPTELIKLSAAALAAKLAAGEVTSVAATQAYLDRIALVDGELHVQVTSGGFSWWL